MRIIRFTCPALGRKKRVEHLPLKLLPKRQRKRQVQVVNPKEKIAGAAAGVDATAKEGISGATAYDTPFHLHLFSYG